MFNKHVLSAAAAIVVGGVLSAPAAAQVSINSGVQARFGHLTRSGDTAPGFDNSINSVDGGRSGGRRSNSVPVMSRLRPER